MVHTQSILLIFLLSITIFTSPCFCTRVINPPQFITHELTTPRMAIGNSSTLFNYTYNLVATAHSLCNTNGISAAERAYFSNKAVMVYGFQGCSYEKVARVAQSLQANAVIFQSRQRVAGKEATYTDGSTSKDISIPMLLMGNEEFSDLYTVAIDNLLQAYVSSNQNPYDYFTKSPAPVVIQMLGAFFSLLWILASSRALYFSFKLHGAYWTNFLGRKVLLTRILLVFEFVANVLRFALFATDPFLIRTSPVLSWHDYIYLLIVHVPIGFASSVCFLFFCLILLVPSRVLLLKAFFVAVTLAILGVDLAACGSNASYKNPNGIDIFAVSFTLNGFEGLLIGIAVGVCCTLILVWRNKQIRYSPRALKRLAVIGLVESCFLIIGAIGSFTVAWLSSEAAYLDVLTLCIHWIGIFGTSGCQIACFPKGKRIKKIKVLKVVDDSHVAHPMKKIVV